MREQRVAIRRQFEEMVLLPDPLDRAVQRTLAVNEVFVLLECLAADAVPALVESFVDVPRRDDAAHELLDRRPMPRLRCPDEVVVRDVEPIPHLTELALHPIAVRERIEPLLARLPVHVLGMLVVAHHEQRLAPGQPLVAGDHVRRDLLVRGAQVRPAVDVVDGCRDVEAGHPNNSMPWSVRETISRVNSARAVCRLNWRAIRGARSLPRTARYDAPSVRKSTEPTDSRPAS